MKKILLVTGLILILILFCTIMLYSQVSTWRQTGGSVSPQTTQSAPRVQPSVPQQQNNVSSWRNNSPQQSQTQPDRRGRVFVQNWNRQNQFGYYWGNWGWYQPMPYIWYDDFGWRQRSVIHVYENGRKDTIRKERVYNAFGFGHTTNKQSAFWGMVGGKKGYFIMDYVMTYDIDRNQYYPNGNLAIADFPVSKEIFTKEHTLYLGAGKRFNKFGVHTMIGFVNEIQRYQGKDDLGGISFPKSNINFTTIKFGFIRDFKFFSLKFDTDPLRGYSQLGIGLNNF